LRSAIRSLCHLTVRSYRPDRDTSCILVSLRRFQQAALLLGATLATWIVTVQRMRGMDAGPGTDSLVPKESP